MGSGVASTVPTPSNGVSPTQSPRPSQVAAKMSSVGVLSELVEHAPGVNAFVASVISATLQE